MDQLPGQNADHLVIFLSNRGLSSHKILQFCILTYPPMYKYPAYHKILVLKSVRRLE